MTAAHSDDLLNIDVPDNGVPPLASCVQTFVEFFTRSGKDEVKAKSMAVIVVHVFKCMDPKTFTDELVPLYQTINAILHAPVVAIFTA